MKKIWAFIKVFYQIRLVYRGDMIIYSISSVLLPLIGLGLWLSASNFANLPYNQHEIIAYFIVAAYITLATEMWQSWFINESINDGMISSYLVKPISLLTRYITENISDKFYKGLMISISLPVIYFIVPQEVWSQFSINPISLTLFLISLILGYIILFMFEMSIGLSSVWFSDINFLKNGIDTLMGLFAGRFVPLAFFSGLLSATATFLPFRYGVSFPAEIVLNKLSSDQLVLGFAVEIFWVIISVMIYKIVRSNFNRDYRGYGA
jgi:ABC-2 type transport system permease protein